MFTTQHYEFLAARFNAALKALWESDVPDGIQVYTLLSLVEQFANTLATDNRIFDYGLFYEAVCNGVPYSMSHIDSYRLSYQGGIRVLENNIDPALRELVREIHTS